MCRLAASQERGHVDESINLKKSGLGSGDQTLLISSYGSASSRPLIQTGAVDGIILFGGAFAPSVFRHVAFVGLAITAQSYSGTQEIKGFFALHPTENLLIEDCEIYNYNTGVVIQQFGGGKNHEDASLRRNIIRDNWKMEVYMFTG